MAAHILRRNFQPIRSALSERNRDRPKHRDHYPTLCEKCVGSFKSLSRRIERLDLRFNVLIREDAKVKPFADIRAKAAPSSQLF